MTLVDKLQSLLNEARKSPMKQSRAWIYADGIEMYLRIGIAWSMWKARSSSVLTIASVSATRTGEGLFKAALAKIEGFADENKLSLYVENVLTDRFAEFWRKRGYVEERAGVGVNISCFSRGCKSS